MGCALEGQDGASSRAFASKCGQNTCNFQKSIAMMKIILLIVHGHVKRKINPIELVIVMIDQIIRYAI